MGGCSFYVLIITLSEMEINNVLVYSRKICLLLSFPGTLSLSCERSGTKLMARKFAIR